MFDKDHSGSIDFHEFADLWNYVSEWQKCFRVYDTDKSGAIDRDELKHALISFGNYGINSCIIHRTFRLGAASSGFVDSFSKVCPPVANLQSSVILSFEMFFFKLPLCLFVFFFQFHFYSNLIKKIWHISFTAYRILNRTISPLDVVLATCLLLLMSTYANV